MKLFAVFWSHVNLAYRDFLIASLSAQGCRRLAIRLLTAEYSGSQKLLFPGDFFSYGICPGIIQKPYSFLLQPTRKINNSLHRVSLSQFCFQSVSLAEKCLRCWTFRQTSSIHSGMVCPAVTKLFRFVHKYQPLHKSKLQQIK